MSARFAGRFLVKAGAIARAKSRYTFTQTCLAAAVGIGTHAVGMIELKPRMSRVDISTLNLPFNIRPRSINTLNTF